MHQVQHTTQVGKRMAFDQHHLQMSSHLLKTPAQKPARLPGRAESIMSVNGSPLYNPIADDEAEAASSRRSTRILAARESSIISVPLLPQGPRQSDIIGHQAPMFELNLTLDGGDAAATASSLRQLDSPARRQVVDHLSRLQQQLQSFVEQIQE